MGVKNGALTAPSAQPSERRPANKDWKVLLKPDWHPAAPYMVMGRADGWGLVSNFEQLFFVTVMALLLAPNTFIAHFTPLPIQSQPRTHPLPPPPRCHPLTTPPPAPPRALLPPQTPLLRIHTRPGAACGAGVWGAPDRRGGGGAECARAPRPGGPGDWWTEGIPA